MLILTFFLLVSYIFVTTSRRVHHLSMTQRQWTTNDNADRWRTTVYIREDDKEILRFVSIYLFSYLFIHFYWADATSSVWQFILSPRPIAATTDDGVGLTWRALLVDDEWQHCRDVDGRDGPTSYRFHFFITSIYSNRLRRVDETLRVKPFLTSSGTYTSRYSWLDINVNM